jgi:hypothetical protein
MSTDVHRQPPFGGAIGGASKNSLEYSDRKIKGLYRRCGGYTAHHLPLPKTSGSIQHDVKSRAESLENQGFIVQRRPEALIDSHLSAGAFLGGYLVGGCEAATGVEGLYERCRP